MIRSGSILRTSLVNAANILVFMSLVKKSTLLVIVTVPVCPLDIMVMLLSMLMSRNGPLTFGYFTNVHEV